ncbi:MAG: phosphate acyltransferase PlsX [Dehalococcoidia bacterium]
MEKPVIAVDAMGGDYAPSEIVKGAVEAARSFDVNIILVGPEKTVQSELSQYGAGRANISFCHAEETIGMDEEPVRAIRRKKDSSIVRGMGLLKAGEASAFVSGGSTGAMVAGALLVVGKKKGISRPALGIVFHSPNGRVLFLDVGANSDCKPQYLVQFAQMGTVYMQRIHGVSVPRVGLLSNGEEETKGNKLARSAYHMLSKDQPNFVGNVEGAELPRGKADVVVTDGFTGNVVIKLSEGLARIFADMSTSAEADGNSLDFHEAEKRILDYTSLGGALLLGVEGNVVITHGKSDATAIERAIGIAEQMVKQKVMETIGT